MPQHTLEERLKNRQAESVSASAAAIAANDAAEQSKPKKKKKKKKKVTKKKAAGVGEASFNLSAAEKKLNAAIAATDDPAKKAEFARRLALMKENTGQ